MSMIGNDDIGLEEVVVAVVAIQVNPRVRWDAGQIWLKFVTQFLTLIPIQVNILDIEDLSNNDDGCK